MCKRKGQWFAACIERAKLALNIDSLVPLLTLERKINNDSMISYEKP